MRLGKWTLSLAVFYRCWCEDHKRSHPTGIRFPFLFVRYPFGGWLVRVLWIEARRWGTLTLYSMQRSDATPAPKFSCVEGSMPLPKKAND